MERYHQDLCECPLLPLTTDFFPVMKDFYSKKFHKAESKSIDKPQNKVSLMHSESSYQSEFLALRLTQNLQLYSPKGLCCFNLAQSNLQMSIGTMYHVMQ